MRSFYLTFSLIRQLSCEEISPFRCRPIFRREIYRGVLAVNAEGEGPAAFLCVNNRRVDALLTHHWRIISLKTVLNVALNRAPGYFVIKQARCYAWLRDKNDFHVDTMGNYGDDNHLRARARGTFVRQTLRLFSAGTHLRILCVADRMREGASRPEAAFVSAKNRSWLMSAGSFLRGDSTPVSTLIHGQSWR